MPTPKDQKRQKLDEKTQQAAQREAERRRAVKERVSKQKWERATRSKVHWTELADTSAYEHGERFFAKHATDDSGNRVLPYDSFAAFEQDFDQGQAYQQRIAKQLQTLAQSQVFPGDFSRQVKSIADELKAEHARQLVESGADIDDLKSKQRLEMLKFRAMARQYRDAVYHLYVLSEQQELHMARARFVEGAGNSAGLMEYLHELTATPEDGNLSTGSKTTADSAENDLDWDKVKERLNQGGITYNPPGKHSVPIKIKADGSYSFNINGASTKALEALADNLLDLMQLRGEDSLESLNLDGKKAAEFNEILRMKAATRGLDLNAACNSAKFTDSRDAWLRGKARGAEGPYVASKAQKRYEKQRHVSNVQNSRTAEEQVQSREGEFVNEDFRARHRQALDELRQAGAKLPDADAPEAGDAPAPK